ncbi:MAG: hypothetical protein A2Z11_03975, partial [Candidatus Woykebacteria bacterium RBG_16_43_9]
SSDQSKLASDTPFTPIASVNYPDKNIYFGPVANVSRRDLQPLATRGTLTLPVRGGQVYEISEDLRRPLEARLERLTSPQQPAPPVDQEIEESQVKEVPQNQGQLSPASSQTVVTELQKLKEMAVKELAQGQKETAPQKELDAPASAPVQRPIAGSTQLREQVTERVVLPDSTNGGAQNLLQRAAQLEAELTQLQQELVATRAEPEGSELPNQPEEKVADEHQVQIEQLVAGRTALSKEVNELTTAHSEELNKRKELEARLEKLKTDYDQNLKVVMDERDQLASSQKQEISKAQALGAQIESMAKEVDQKLAQIQIEKTNLLDQAKKLQEGHGQLQRQQEESREQSEQNAQLRTQLQTAEKERDEMKDRYDKLKVLVEDLRSKPRAPSMAPAVAEPKKESGDYKDTRQEVPAARVVKPQPAVGKMAPSLTSTPNVINGIIRSPDGLLLSSVIIVVKDATDQPVRALKSNKIGQFAISTPLPNGTYTMELESPGHSFDIIQVEINGKVMPPIEIRANN